MMTRMKTTRRFYLSPILPQMQPPAPASTKTRVRPYVVALAYRAMCKGLQHSGRELQSALSLKLPALPYYLKFLHRPVVLHLLVPRPPQPPATATLLATLPIHQCKIASLDLFHPIKPPHLKPLAYHRAVDLVRKVVMERQAWGPAFLTSTTQA
jgi:hypothetical protein